MVLHDCGIFSPVSWYVPATRVVVLGLMMNDWDWAAAAWWTGLKKMGLLFLMLAGCRQGLIFWFYHELEVVR